VAYLTGRPAARFVVAEHFGRVQTQSELLLPFAIAVTLCLTATVAPLMMARRRLEGLERD
jgi:ABC-2 type transport system permease protein